MRDADMHESETVIPPSSLFVFWPGDEPPMAEEIRVRLSDWGTVPGDIDVLPPEDTLWSFWFEVAERPVSYLVWCEQVTGAHLRMLNDVKWRNADQRAAAMATTWMVGIEGPMSLAEPVRDFQRQLRLCEAIGRDWSPVVYDANACRFHVRSDLLPLITSRIPPRTSSLFMIHKVRSSRPGLEPRYWLHTHGLERAGIPDLELFDVPEPLLGAACELMETVADLWIECSTPEPQVPFSVGRGLELAWRPWQAAVATLDRAAVGGWNNRGPDTAHDGYRAVLVTSKVDGWFARRWTTPTALLEKLTESQATVYKTTGETGRMTDLARERWANFGMIFASGHPADWRFAVKLQFDVEQAIGSTEHLWFDVQGIRPGEVLGKLVSTPAAVSHLVPGVSEWHRLERMSDWRIVTPEGVYSPETADLLLEELSAAI